MVMSSMNHHQIHNRDVVNDEIIRNNEGALSDTQMLFLFTEIHGITFVMTFKKRLKDLVVKF